MEKTAKQKKNYEKHRNIGDVKKPLATSDRKNRLWNINYPLPKSRKNKPKKQ